MSKITTTKEGNGRYGAIWRVLVNGQPTSLRVTKSVPPRYRMHQEWDVFAGPDEDLDLLFSAQGLAHAIVIIEAVLEAGASAYCRTAQGED